MTELDWLPHYEGLAAEVYGRYGYRNGGASVNIYDELGEARRRAGVDRLRKQDRRPGRADDNRFASVASRAGDQRHWQARDAAGTAAMRPVFRRTGSGSIRRSWNGRNWFGSVRKGNPGTRCRLGVNRCLIGLKVLVVLTQDMD